MAVHGENENDKVNIKKHKDVEQCRQDTGSLIERIMVNDEQRRTENVEAVYLFQQSCTRSLAGKAIYKMTSGY